MVEMEPEGELRPESSLLSGSFVDEQPSSEQTHGASGESPSGSLGKVTSASQKRKNRKRNKKKTSPDSELQSPFSSLSSAPSSLDCSLTPDVADARIPVEESQHTEAKSIDLMSFTDDSSGQIRNASLHADQGEEFVSKAGIQNPSEQNNNMGAVSQPAVTAVTGEKVEDDSSREVEVVAEQIDPSKKQCATSSVGPGQLSESTSTISDGSVSQPVSKGDTDNSSSDLNVDITSTEEKGSGSSTEHQNCGTKKSLPESEVKNSNSTVVTEEAKQQRSSDSKKAKLNAAKQENVSEKGQKICTPVEESGKERRDSADAGNQRPQTRNKKASAEERNHEDPAVKKNQTPVETITVYFHAILSKDFKINLDKDKVIILAGGISDYTDWKDTVCELTFTRELEGHGYLIEGHTIISKENLDKSVSYKYVVKGDKQIYEYIYKHATDGVHVNRSLYLSSKLIGGTDWHQYDDIICCRPEDSLWKKIKNQIWKDKEKDIVKGKLIAARIMLDSLFSILSPLSRINIKSFFQQFKQFYHVNKRVMVHEGCRKEWKELQFEERQLKDLIMNYLMEESSNILKQNTSMWDKLGLALIAFTLITDYDIQLPKKELKQLCVFLCPEKSLADVNETKSFRETFSEHLGITEKLITFYDKCIEKEIHQWVWTLPVLYLFTVNDSEYKTRTCLESEEKWARLECIRYSEFRDKTRNLYKNIIMEKKHLLKGSRTLFRSWFCLLPLCDLGEFISDPYADPFDCLLGTFHRLKTLRIDRQNVQDVEKLLEKLLHILSEKKITIQKEDWTCSAVAFQNLHMICSSQVPEISQYKLLATAVEIVSTILALTPSEVSEMEFATTIFQNVCKTTSNWFHHCLPKPLRETRSVTFSYRKELEAWDHFLKIKFPNSNTSEDWKETLISILKSRIKQEGAVEQIKIYCSRYEEIQKLNCVILQIFENCALEAIDSAYQKQQNLLDLISQYDRNKLGKIISAAIITPWPKDDTGTPLEDFQSILKHLFEWQDSKYIFIFNRAEENTLNQFADEAQLLMTLAESSLQTAANDLVTGHIQIKNLDLIIKYKTQFIKCMEQSHPNELLEGLKLEKVVDLRLQEVRHVKMEQKYLGVLLDMLRKVQCYLKVDLTEVEQKHSGNLAEKTLDDVVKVREPTSCSDDRIETRLHLSEDLKYVSKVVYDYKDSHIFLHCWEQAAKMLMENSDMENSDTEETLDMEDVNYCLFVPCYKEFQRIYDSLKLGDLTFAEVNVLFKDFNNDYEELRRDFKIMCKLQTHDNGEWIGERIQQIQQYHELGLALDSAKVIDKVKGVLKLSGDFSVLQQLLNLTREFQDFQEEKLSSMSRSLMHAKKLLQDITKERRLCLEELAVRKEFVHWVKEALEDKNELKVFVELASISAGENDMDVDRVACFHDAVYGYSSLLYDLRREAGFKEFMKCLETIWKALESDHNLPTKLRDSARYLDWLKTIKESHGSVELSSISLATSINEKGIYRIKAPVEGQKVCLDAVLDLTIQENHGDQDKNRKYSLEELQELMNKLMLMSGKEEQSAQVEKFSEVFSSVQRFALSFMNLYSAGNMLFRNWVADIYCSPESQFCIKMNFNLNSLRGLWGSGDVAEVLPATCKKMESFLEKWNQFMSEKRSQYFYLNYYTANQLVYLCKELGSGKPSESALMMLSFIKYSCSRQDIKEVSKRVISEITNSLDVMYVQTSRKELTECLEEIWGSYMENMGLFLPDCFDIETLGRFLSNLADLEKRSVVRVLPQGLHTRQPNLILCPRSEILVSTISVYMNSPEEMLPSYDELLLCTPQTSYEQVELFMRRCLTPNNKDEKIYTLLFADELSYDVSYKLEELYKNLHLKNSSDYHLVIFCNCEREHFYIPSVFSNYIIHMTPLRLLKDIQSYLGKHYKATELGNPSTSVFKNNMCVGIVSSERAGMGKSLYIKRMYEKMKGQFQERVHLKTIRLIDSHVNERKILNSLFLLLDQKYQKQPMIVHFDITSSVQTGISEFLFKLFILRYLEDADGKIWLRKQCHLYVAEILQPPHSPKKQRGSKFPGLNYSFFDVFPQITCRSPKEVLDNGFQMNLFQDSSDPRVDEGMFCSEAFQRPFQYLIRENRGENLDAFQYREGSVEGTPGECLQLFLMYCGVIDPSWSELRNFAWFLNLQLRNCETSVFCNANFVQDTLQGFKNFVVKFMILMAKDFATPSLNISDESPGMQVFEEVTEEALAPFLLRKKWESEPHPYIFFNEDGISMTFIGFHLQYNNSGSIDAINPLNGNIIKRNVMTKQLFKGLVLQRVPFNIDFDALTRAEKIEKLCMVLGIQWPTDPDETYELTTDNILKMLAIEMRFRCGIPVVLMGETGCGKTRLIKYLCELRKSGADSDNLKLVKVHGGTTADAIYAKVREAEDMARYNKLNYHCDTILFFDEANTTDAVSSIKEVLCDHTIEGQPLRPNSGLQIIAACNPYRKHTPKMIQRLESAGLGYRVKAEDTSEKLGSIPLRQLVYRVHALPPSMIPLVWDFGQLNNITEKLYIEQIVHKLSKSVAMSSAEIHMTTEVLFKSQTYMRLRKDECSFISLRDVERCVEVFKWFHGYSERLMKHLEKFLERNPPKSVIQRDRIIWSLILSLGVCYHASLERKEAYWRFICKIFPEPYDNEKVVLEEISLIQDLFLSGVPVRQRIAKNMALKENVFMMVICIELKIPLFLIGKPGSSKSLAKTIVADAMQGQAAHSDLYKKLKQIHLVSFQCSPHSTPEGIINTFKHCARFQEGKNLREYVSVVVLDEIGLAEDSPKMPLKTLHPLLEDGCIDDDPLPHKKVGFVGISNWALDPAKMNRGIFVSRGDLNKNELIESAKGICSSERFVLQKVERFFPIFASAYEEICQNKIKDFFGLRDYYSLVKMLFALTKHSKSTPGPREIAEVVLRNFSGREGVEVLDTFMSKIPEGEDENYKDINTVDLIGQNIHSNYQDGECRYLLVLTENYAALQILQQSFFRDAQPEIIFGSSFPKDQEYTQICRNINRVKICMETGKMVVLLNLQNLYESLYDALNQYYVQLAGQKYVDLGLGTHRVKCRVHPKFRLIVIEEKNVVYKQFPIPLINRLEKHHLDINTVLNKWQKTIVEDLKKWVENFVAAKTEKYFTGQQTYRPSDVFIGYHSDSCASVVLQVTENLKESHPAQLRQKVQEQSELVLLNCATPDSVVRLGDSKLNFLSDKLAKIYFQQQQHTSFAEFLHRCLRSDSRGHTVFIEMTTFSRLLTAADTQILEAELQLNSDSLKVLFLQQFDTEFSFLKDIRNFFAVQTDGSKILIIQTDFENGSLSAQLIASARYSAVNEVNKIQENQARVFIIFITKLSRIEGGSSYIGFHGGLWQSVHIDDLRTSKDMISDITSLRNITISQLFSENTGESAENSETAGTEEEEIEEEMEVEVVASPISSKVLDTTILLRSCVQSAVSMLRDHNENAGRSAKRIEILLSLLSEEDTLQGTFLKITKSRLTCLLKKQEENSFSMKEWVLREASNLTALQEGGTFRRTLWKRIQSMVTPLLAYMVSILDRDYNLDLLVKPRTEDCVKALWLFIFNELKLLDIPYVMGQSSTQTKPIQVQNDMEVSTGAGNKMPFSWRIKDYLEDLWAQAQHVTKNEAHAEKFLDIFQMTPLGQHIARYSEEEKAVFFHYYVRDFILLAMGVTSERELNMLQAALLSCVEEMNATSSSAESRVPSLPWVHLAYHQFRSRLQNFSRILAVYPEVLHTLEQIKNNGGCMLQSQMVVDVFAALACTEMLSSAVLEQETRAWLQQVKDLQMPIELVCAANCSQGRGSQCSQMLQEVKSQWNRIFSMSLFVEHVLLGAEMLIPELKDLVKKYIMQLRNCFQWDSNIKEMRTFTAVMRMLCQCKEEASRSFCRFGLNPCPICLGDPRDPINLPCDHVYCYDCIKQWLGPGQMICPLCMVSLPDDYNLRVSEEHSIAIKKKAQFRKLCNNFFIDLVSTMCFKGNKPPEKSVIVQLLDLMFVHKSALKGPESLHTKSLSPFDDVVDKTPVIRSAVLKLLLKYSFSDVEVYIQKHLSKVEENHIIDKEDKIELYMLFISCFEDSLSEKTGNFPKETKICCLAKDGHFLERSFHRYKSSHPVSQKITIEYLQGIANLRLCMDRAAEVIFELHETSASSEKKEKQIHLEKLRQFFCHTQNNWHKIYLVRKLTSQYGLEFTQKLLNNHRYHWVFPSEIIEQQAFQPGHIDRFLVCGKDYKAIRNSVEEALITCKTEVISAALKAYKGSKSALPVHFLLTIFRELTSLYGCRDPKAHPKQEQCDILKEFIQNPRVLPSAELKSFAESLVSNQLPLLTLAPLSFGRNTMVIEMAVHTAVVLLCGQNRILEPLRNLAFSPSTMLNAFLPTMPEDMLAQAQKWKIKGNVHWYTCPNGHPCVIGECGQPMQRSRCVDCGVEIGGDGHRPLPNFKRASYIQDRTQTGHILGDPRKRGPELTSEREMSPAVLILIRLLTHLALLLGASNDVQSLSQIIKPQVPDPVNFLLQHIGKDLEQLMNTLGKSADETTNVIHLILCSLSKDQHAGQWPVHFNSQLSIKEHRNNWEGTVACTIILPELKLLDKALLDLNKQISEDERLSSNPIVKIIYGDPADFLSHLPKDRAIHSSRIWSCKKRITVEHLAHIVQQKGGKDTVPILQKFLQKEAELRQVKFLPEILALQKDLVKRFQNVSEIEHRTIEDFLSSFYSGVGSQMKGRVEKFLDVWNKLRLSIEANGEIKLPKDYCSMDRTVKDPFEILLPRRRDLGLCATSLVSYLIQLHNDFVNTIAKDSADANRYSVSPAEVADLHMISYEVEKDLMPIILSNCQYSVQKGGEALQEFDLEKIEQQVVSRFLQGKPKISLQGIPTLIHRYDQNYEHLFSNIKRKLETLSTLSNSKMGTIRGDLVSYSDICEALSVTEIILGFLATTGGDSHMTLADYTKNVLQMSNQISLPVEKALSRCQLKHAISLWQLLSSHKSEQLLHLKKDPFAEISAAYKEEVTGESVDLLKAFLTQTGLEPFLQELHEMIMLKLKHAKVGEEYNPTWGLKEVLIPYLEGKGSSELQDLDDTFPDDILVSQCIAAWKIAATLKRSGCGPGN